MNALTIIELSQQKCNGKYWQLKPAQQKTFNTIETMLSVTIKNINQSFIVIGYALNKLREEKLVTDVYAYGLEKLNLKETAVKNLIAVYKKFANGATESEQVALKKEFEKYSYSQLVEMLPVKEDKLWYFQTHMSVREMKREKNRISSAWLEPGTTLLAKPSQTSDLKTNIVAQAKNVTSEVVTPNEIIKYTTQFRNDVERKKFLDDCEKWPLWLEIPALKLKVYRVELSDGFIILAYVNAEKSLNKAYHKFKSEKEICFSRYFENEGYIVDHMRQNKLSVK